MTTPDTLTFDKIETFSKKLLRCGVAGIVGAIALTGTLGAATIGGGNAVGLRMVINMMGLLVVAVCFFLPNKASATERMDGTALLLSFVGIGVYVAALLSNFYFVGFSAF